MRHPDERPDGGRWSGADHPDEGTIHAWLDDALRPDEAAGLERHVAGCARCAAAVAEARGLIAASSQILARLDAAPGGVLPAAPAAPAAPASGPTPGGAAGGAAGGAGRRSRPGAGADDVVPLASRRPAAVPLWRRGAVRALAAVALVAVGATAVLRETGTGRSLSEISATAERAAPDMGRETMETSPATPEATEDMVADTMAAATAARSGAADAAGTGSTGSAPERTPEGARRAPLGAPAAKTAPDQAAGRSESAERRAPSVAPSAAPAPAAPEAARQAQVQSETQAEKQASSRTRADSQRRAAVVAADAATSAANDALALAPVPTGVAAAPAPPPPVPPPAPAGSTVTARAFSQGADSQRAEAQRAEAQRAGIRRADTAGLAGQVSARAGGVAGADSGTGSPADSARRAALRGRVAAPTAVASAPAAPVPPEVERFAGCYRISVRGAVGEVRDRIEGELPGWLLLDPAPRATAGWHVAASAASEEDEVTARWRVSGALVLVEWPLDGQVIDLRLRSWAEGLAGTAALRAEGERGEEVSVLARRVACGGA